MTRTLPAGDFAIGDDRTARPRRPCVAPALHVPADGIPQHVHDRATVVRRAEERQVALDAQLDPLLADALEITRETLRLRIVDGQALEHAARNLVQALAPLIERPAPPPRIGDATTVVHRALLAGGVDRSTATHFTRLVIDALAAADRIR